MTSKSTGRRKIGKTDYQARGVLYLPEKARFSKLLSLPEGADVGKAINEAMKAIEDENYLSERLDVKVDLVEKTALKPAIGRHILEEVLPV